MKYRTRITSGQMEGKHAEPFWSAGIVTLSDLSFVFTDVTQKIHNYPQKNTQLPTKNTQLPTKKYTITHKKYTITHNTTTFTILETKQII